MYYNQSILQYKVPNGFCLSSNALKIQIESNKKIKEAISEIEATTNNFDDNRLKNTCEKLVKNNAFKFKIFNLLHYLHCKLQSC